MMTTPKQSSFSLAALSHGHLASLSIPFLRSPGNVLNLPTLTPKRLAAANHANSQHDSKLTKSQLVENKDQSLFQIATKIKGQVG